MERKFLWNESSYGAIVPVRIASNLIIVGLKKIVNRFFLNTGDVTDLLAEFTSWDGSGQRVFPTV